MIIRHHRAAAVGAHGKGKCVRKFSKARVATFQPHRASQKANDAGFAREYRRIAVIPMRTLAPALQRAL